MRLKPARQSVISPGKVPIKGVQWAVGSHMGHGCRPNPHNCNKSLSVGPEYCLGKHPQQ